MCRFNDHLGEPDDVNLFLHAGQPRFTNWRSCAHVSSPYTVFTGDICAFSYIKDNLKTSMMDPSPSNFLHHPNQKILFRRCDDTRNISTYVVNLACLRGYLACGRVLPAI